MAQKRSKEVDIAVKKLYAKMATRAAERSLVQVSLGDMRGADDTVGWVTEWLECAGADATRNYFNV